jgi:uncharacterized protein
MSLKDTLAEDLKDALRQGDESRKTAIRMTTTAIKNAEVEAGKPLDDPEVLKVIAKQVKQRRESIEEFQKAGRQDLVDKEAAELKFLEAYMPPAMSRDEIVETVTRVIREVGAAGPSDKGKVMQKVMPELSGRAEGREISEVVNELLAASSS